MAREWQKCPTDNKIYHLTGSLALKPSGEQSLAVVLVFNWMKIICAGVSPARGEEASCLTIAVARITPRRIPPQAEVSYPAMHVNPAFSIDQQ
ncbi:MAG: hypothetical protein XXXJIFNMEKO3_02008 [Candidatus Erwinia impunctatus]|nr:hypothetical protein XXXJIFNMEKO_02008 [Culicoides impunctatus]